MAADILGRSGNRPLSLHRFAEASRTFATQISTSQRDRYERWIRERRKDSAGAPCKTSIRAVKLSPSSSGATIVSHSSTAPVDTTPVDTASAVNATPIGDAAAIDPTPVDARIHAAII